MSGVLDGSPPSHVAHGQDGIAPEAFIGAEDRAAARNGGGVIVFGAALRDQQIIPVADVIADDLKLLVQGIIQESGASGIFYSVQNGEENRFTAEEYENWVKPSDKKVLDYANTLSDMNAIHFCAWEAIPNRLSVWKDYKAPVVSWSRYFDIMDINEAKKHFGCTVWGGFDNRPGTLLYTGTRADIENETAKLIWQGGKRGYILGADCSIHNELPEARIRWVVEKAHTL